MSEQTIPEMRERIEELQKQLKAKDGRESELAKENRVLKAREVFREQGYDPKHGELFATANADGDITPEAVTGFAEQWSLNPLPKETEAQSEGTPAPEQQEEPSVPAGSTNLAGMSGGGSGPGGGGQPAATDGTMTRQQWNELNSTDPVAAKEALSKGRVQLRGDNPLAVHR